MRTEDLSRHGASLAERVSRQVDTTERLDMMLRQHRRQRITAFAMAAAAVIAVVVGAVLVFTNEGAPVVTQPPTTAPTEPQALPAQVFLVLRSDYTVDEATGSCRGSGPLEGIEESSLVSVWDESIDASPEDSPAIALPSGMEITASNQLAALLRLEGGSTACLFELPDLGHDISEYDHISLFPQSDPDVPGTMTVSGQRVVFTLGADPAEPGFESNPGVASDIPEEWQAELQTLRDSAGPGLIVGSVALWGDHHTPLASSQPFCTGAAQFADLEPGQAVIVTDQDGNVIGQTILRGSAFDAHEGCSLWFGVDVPPDMAVYLIAITEHAPVAFDRAVLDEFGWRIDLWSDPIQMQTVCVELEPESRPMTCVLLEPGQETRGG